METLDSPATAGRPLTHDVVERLLAVTRPGSVLCLAPDLPDPLCHTPARIVLLGSRLPTRAVAAHAVDFRRAESQADLLAALDEYARRGERFDVIFVDHDHRISALIDQIEHADRLAHAATVWMFDDAVPPELDMAADEPRPGWWVGSVWMIPLLELFRNGADTLCIDSRPTGCFAAVGRASVERSNLLEAACALRERTGTMAALREALSLADEARLDEYADHLTRLALEHGHLALRAAAESDYAARIVEELAAEGRFLRGRPVVFADLSGGEIEHRFDAPQEEMLYGQALVQWSGATLIGTNAIVLDGIYYSRYSKTGAGDLQRIARATGYGNDGTGIIEVEGSPWLPRAQLEQAIRLPGRHLLATPDERDNWGMWLLVALPSVLFYLEHRTEYSGLICHSPRPWQIEFLRFLGVRDDEVLRQEIGASYAPEHLDILGRGSRNLCVTASDRRFFGQTVERAMAAGASTAEAPAAGRRLYVSRLGASHEGYRMMVEEESLIRRLEPLGFAIVEPERLAFAEQIRRFHQADVIVGPGGAGMFNAVFARPGTAIVTIEGAPNWVHAHANLFASCGLSYGVILGRPDPTDEAPVHKRWHIDVDAVIETLLPLL